MTIGGSTRSPVTETAKPLGLPRRAALAWGGPVQDCVLRLHVLRWRFGFRPDPKQRAPGWSSFAYGLSADVTLYIILRDNARTRIASSHEPLKANGVTTSMEPVYRCRTVPWFLGLSSSPEDFGSSVRQRSCWGGGTSGERIEGRAYPPPINEQAPLRHVWSVT